MNCIFLRRPYIEDVAPVTEKITLYPSGYDSVNYSYASVNSSYPLSNPVGKGSDNTTYSQWNIKTGEDAESYVFYTFDTSQIPANATIDSVTCKAKGYVSTETIGYIRIRQMQMYSGISTRIGTGLNLTTTATEQIFETVTDWTRDMLNDFRIRCYAERGISGTSTSRSMRFYGATLEITYTYKPTQGGGGGGGSNTPTPPPTNIPVTVTGSGNSTGCYIKINNTKITSAGTYTVQAGDTIVLTISSPSNTAGYVWINDEMETGGMDFDEESCNMIVPQGTYAITINLKWESNAGTITVITA